MAIKDMGKKRISLKYILLVDVLFWLGLFLIAYLTNNNPFLSSIRREFSIHEYIMLLLCIIFTLGAYFYIEIKNKTLKLSFVFLFILLALFAVSLFVIWLSPNQANYTIKLGETEPFTISYTLDIQSRVMYSINSLFIFLVPYLLIVALPQKIKKISFLYPIYIIFIVVALASIVYSFTSEMDYYKAFFLDFFHFDKYDGKLLESWFGNKNIFGIYLFLGLMGMLRIHNDHPKWYFSIIILVILFFIFISFCKAAIISSIPLVAAYFLYRFIVTIKKHLFRNIIAISIVSSLVIIVIALIIVGHIGINGYFASMVTVFEKLLFDVADSTISSRYKLWETTIQLFLTNPVFGLGIGIFNAVLSLGNTQNTGMSHNALLDLLGRGGIILVGAYLLLLTYLIVITFKTMKYAKKTGWLTLFLFLAYFAISFVESDILFNIDFLSIVASTTIFVPTLIEYYNHKFPKRNQELNKEINKFVKGEVPSLNSFDYKNILINVMSIISGVIIGLISVYGISKNFSSFQVITFVIYLILITVCAPYAFAKIRISNKIIHAITLFLLVLIVYSLGFVLLLVPAFIFLIVDLLMFSIFVIYLSLFYQELKKDKFLINIVFTFISLFIAFAVSFGVSFSIFPADQLITIIIGTVLSIATIKILFSVIPAINKFYSGSNKLLSKINYVFLKRFFK